MSWVFLILAGVFEIIWAVVLKLSNGFSKPKYTLLSLITILASIYFLSAAMKNLPLSIAYSIWVAIGVLGSVIVSALYFNEPMGWFKVLSLTLILLGVVGLKVSE